MIHLNDLEPGIRNLVAQFIEAGRPSARQQSFQERRQGYLNTIDLAGEAVPVWNIIDRTIDGLPLRIYKPSDQTNLPILIYYHGGCFVSGDLETHDRQLRMLANLSNSSLLPSVIDWHRNTFIQLHMTMQLKLHISSVSMLRIGVET